MNNLSPTLLTFFSFFSFSFPFLLGVLLPVFYELDSISLQPDFMSSTSSSPASSSSSSRVVGSSKYPHIHFQELLDRETIRIDAVKEKGGTLIKFTNYVVKSDVQFSIFQPLKKIPTKKITETTNRD